MKKIKYLIPTLVFAVISVALATTLVLVMINKKNDGSVQNSDIEYVPEEEKNDESTASLEYKGYVTVNQAEKNISLYFKNPGKSRKSLNFEIIGNINGETVKLGEFTGLVPGAKVETMNLQDIPNLEAGKYKGKFIVHFFNGENKKEIVNSEVNIDVIVK